jgi:hypothetical protein
MVVALVAPELPKDCAFASPEYKQIIGRLRKFQAMPRPVSLGYFDSVISAIDSRISTRGVSCRPELPSLG